MAILQSTGIRGFLVSVKKTGNKVVNSIGKTIDKYTENFLSGFAGHVEAKSGSIGNLEIVDGDIVVI